MKLAALLVLPAMLLAQQTVVQDPDKASLEGHVVNAVTGEPLRKTRLTLRMNVAQTQATRQQPTAQPAAVTVTSDPSGKFLFPNLDPGDYQLTARRDGFANVQLGNREGGKKPDPILLTKGDRKTGLTLKMTPFGSVSGRVLDEDGDPVRDMHVALLKYEYTTRGRQLIEGGGGSATTNDLGEYRIYDIPSGKYFLKAGPSQTSARVLSSREDIETFVPTFYPGAQDAASSAPVETMPGQQLRGLNLTLRKARYATIRGRVIAPPGTSVSAGLMVTSDSGSSSSSNSVNDKDGKFEFLGVPPGRIFVIGSYTLAGRRHSAQIPIDVGSSDIDGLELRPLAPMEVIGQVRIDGPSSTKLSEINVGLRTGGRSMSTGAREDGTVAFREVEPGQYRIEPGRSQNLYLKSVHWGTNDITEGEIDLTNGVPPQTEFSIIFGADAGQIEGLVKNDDSEPAGSVTVTLVPAGSRRLRSYYKTSSTDATGRYAIRGIAPGSYKIFAWDKVDINAVMYDPDFLRPYEGAGQTIEIHPNDKKSVDVKLTLNKSQ